MEEKKTKKKKTMKLPNRCLDFSFYQSESFIPGLYLSIFVFYSEFSQRENMIMLTSRFHLSDFHPHLAIHQFILALKIETDYETKKKLQLLPTSLFVRHMWCLSVAGFIQTLQEEEKEARRWSRSRSRCQRLDSLFQRLKSSLSLRERKHSEDVISSDIHIMSPF